jgi:protein-S-isoprenylcysteine O-methyltransferase Ste14
LVRHWLVFASDNWWGLAPVAIMFPFFIWQLFDEERFLSANLDGTANT